MGVRGREQGAQGAGASLLGAVVAVGGAAAMAGAAGTLVSTARGAHGEEQLIGWVLAGLAGAGAVLCLYLALIWGLAAAILLAGPAGRTGRMLLPALRVLAPRLARRVSMGAAVATAATGLVLGPALASEQLLLEEEVPTSSRSAQQLPGEEPAPAEPQESEPAAPLPSLGWGEDPARDPEDPAATTAPGSSKGAGTPTGTPAQPNDDDATQESGPAVGGESGRTQRAPAPVSTADDGDADGPGASEQETPGGSTSPAPAAGAAQQSSDTEETEEDAAYAAGEDGDEIPPRTVVVQHGDTLWSITDDVLGPAPDDPSLLADSWPLLHQANHDVIGEDPDLLVPGQVLAVPAALDEEARS